EAFELSLYDLHRIVQNGFSMNARNFLIQDSENKRLRDYYNYLNAMLKNIKEWVFPSQDDQALKK
ncbi:1360_t:CDS:2, partial [Gigaspora margarita]